MGSIYGPRGERENLSREELIAAAINVLTSDKYYYTNTDECIQKIHSGRTTTNKGKKYRKPKRSKDVNE